jgi:hypothetical protein
MKVLILLAGLSSSSAALAVSDPTVSDDMWSEGKTITDWSRALRNFRRDHNFAVNVGTVYTKWKGLLPGYDRKFSFETRGYSVGCEYSFHIPWGYGFGYRLGTSTGIIFSEQNDDKYETYYRAILPGLEAGIVWNASDRIRLSATFVYGWQRVDGLRFSPEWGDRKVSFTGETLSQKASLEYFYNLTTAAIITYDQGLFFYSESEKYEIQETTKALSVGIVKHLL